MPYKRNTKTFMYVIKATRNAPTIALKIKKKLLAAWKCCSNSIITQQRCRKNKWKKAFNNPPCRKPIKHNKFHNVKSVACSFFTGSVFVAGKLSKPTEHGMRGTEKPCRINAGGILEPKKMRGSGVEIKPPFGKSFLCGQQRNPFRVSNLTKHCLLY